MSIVLQALLILLLSVQLYALRAHGVSLKIVIPCLIFFYLLRRIRPSILNLYLFALGAVLPLFGYQTYTIQNLWFETIICFLCLNFLAGSSKKIVEKNSNVIHGLIITYFFIVLFSLFQLPVESIWQTLKLWGVYDFHVGVFAATPDSFYYSIGATIRLFLFILFIISLNLHDAKINYYRYIIKGCGFGVLALCVGGLFQYFGFFSLEWYRPDFLTPAGVHRFHSLMGNPGWFAEYAVVCLPFVGILFRPGKSRISSWAFISSVILIGVCLVFTGSRTSWLLFPFGVFITYFLIDYCQSQRVNNSFNILVAESAKKTFIIAILLTLGLVFIHFQPLQSENAKTTIEQKEFLQDRISEIFLPTVRQELWAETLNVIRGNVLLGKGYESYRWHKEVVEKRKTKEAETKSIDSEQWDTPHQFYLQIVCGNGLVGLIIWFILFFCVIKNLVQSCKGRNEMISGVMLASFILFFLYGLTQSMQYIGIVYFLVFILMGYSCTLNESSIDIQYSLPKKLVYCGIIPLLVVVFWKYSLNWMSHNDAKDLGISHYRSNSNDHLFRGFYKKEDWGESGIYRWSGRRAEVLIEKNGLYRIRFACHAPRLDILPVQLTVYRNEVEVEELIFTHPENVTRMYYFDNHGSGMNRLVIHVSRIWSPKREHLNDDARYLGVAVSEPSYISNITHIINLVL